MVNAKQAIIELEREGWLIFGQAKIEISCDGMTRRINLHLEKFSKSVDYSITVSAKDLKAKIKKLAAENRELMSKDSQLEMFATEGKKQARRHA